MDMSLWISLFFNKLLLSVLGVFLPYSQKWLSKLAESIVSLAVERTSDPLTYEAASFAGVRDDVVQLRSELTRMLCFLKDADRVQERDERVRNWIAEVKDVASYTEDAIEIFVVEISSSYLKLFPLRRLRSEIRSIHVRIDGIFRSTQTYGIRFVPASDSVAERRRNLRRSWPDDDEEDDVVSLEHNVRDLKARLMADDDHDYPNYHNRLCVVSIVGMGGLGKTTLAKKLFNDSDVKEHFDCRAWVFISQQCVPRDVLSEILIKVGFDEKQSAEKMKDDENQLLMMRKKMAALTSGSEERRLIDLIKEELKEKRFLVVLDDVWKVDAWDSIKSAFSKGKKGSKVLLTTRIKELALSADPYSDPIEPALLTFDKGWELLCRRAFPSDAHGDRGCVCPPEFEKLGKDMLRKCGGLPLAIVVLGGMLSTKTSLEGLKKVQRDVNSHLTKLKSQEPFGVEEILALSYYDLPYYLKPCFLYLGCFPEDCEIPKKNLIRLWIAEGFVPTPTGDDQLEETMEDIAEQYLVELVDRCMVQVDKRDHTGVGIKTCRKHDLMRDFCIYKAKEENFFKIIERQGKNMIDAGSSSEYLPTTHPRRFAIQNGCDLPRYEQVHPHIRSLLFFAIKTLPILPFTNKNFRLLSVLEFGFTASYIGSVPRQIGNLIHLRYLGLRGAGLSKLPSSVGNLRNLHTLDLRNNNGLKLPWTISKLTRLRHLLLPEICRLVVPMSCSWPGSRCGLDNLTNLDTLKYISSEDLIRCDAGKKLTNIRNLGIKFKSKKDIGEILPIVESGHLRTLRMSLLSDEAFPSMESLSGCHLLSKLVVEGKLQEDIRSCHSILHFLPESLAKMVLIRSEIKQDPMAILERLPNLRFLQLHNSYTGSKMVCSAHGFPKLETLKLISLFDVEEWKVKENSMPSLKTLHIEGMRKLSLIPKGLKFVTTLRELSIRFMSQSFVDRIRVNEVGIEGEDLYKVRHVPSISFSSTYN